MGRFSLTSKTSSGENPGPSVKERVTKNWHLILTLAVIVAVAFILRAFFAYDVAVAGGYGLSGGSDAAYHLRVIESIMTNTGHVISDSAMNYPYGEINVNPPLMDWIYAIFASLVTLFGVSTEAAATGVLVWSAPVLGALTCIPVYYLAREMFDHKAGIISALLYTICAIAISQTVLSNGTEAAFYGFFFVWMVYFLYKAMKAAKSDIPERKKGEIGNYAKSVFNINRDALKYALFASIMLIIVELSWNGFRPIILMIAFMMIVQVIMDRIRGKDPTSSMVIYGSVLVVSTIVCAPIYAAVSLWSLVYSGSFFIVLFSVLFALIMSETKGKPWVLVLPILIVALAVILAVLWFAAPGLFSDIVSGNSIYTDPTFVSLVGMNSSASLSTMAGYYGWLTIWLPYVLIALMIYRFSENIATPAKTFVLMWMVAMMAISLSASSNLFLAAPAYMIGAGVMVAKVLQKGDLPAYVASFKGVGLHFKGIIKKIFQPAALSSILMAAFLVVTPNAMYAIDAATPSNETSSSAVDDYTGAFSYYVKNNEDWKMNDLWDHYANESKGGSMVSWWDYSAEAAAKGGFESVAGANGAGAAAASNILLAQGGAAANIAMTVRLLESDGITQHRDYLVNLIGEDNYNELVKILSEPEKYIKEILENPNTYGTFSSNLTAENAMYIASAYLLHDVVGLSEADTVELYDKVCGGSNKKIQYIVVSRGMFPIAYGDGSVFNTLAYMNNHYLDSNGSPTDFYSYASSGYYTYTDAMYDTLIWKAYIGPSPSDMGYTSATTMFNAFALSDGSENTIPQPGFGLSNYEISYWQVLYNSDPEATNESDGWVQMDAFEAMAKQKKDGGLINYMSGLPVVLEYVSGGTVITGKVTTSGTEGVENARVTYVDENGFQKATVYTDENGEYRLTVTSTGGKIEVHMGSSDDMGGLRVYSEPIGGSTVHDIDVEFFSFDGRVYYEDIDTPVFVEGALTVDIEGKVHGKKATVGTSNGIFSSSGSFIPDTYTITVKDENGNSICTATYEPMFGIDSTNTVAVEMFITTSTVTVKLTDEFGSPLSSDVDLGADKPYVLLTSTNEGDKFEVIVELVNGEGTAKVVPGTYKASLSDAAGNPHTSYDLFDQTVTVASGSSATLNAKAQPFAEIKGAIGVDVPVVITNIGTQILTDSTTLSTGVKVPVGADGTVYYVYAKYTMANGTDMIKWAVTSSLKTGSGLYTIASFDDEPAYEFSKTIKTTEDKAVAGVLNFYPDNDSPDAAPIFASAVSNNGKVSIWLPEGDYILHAYSSDSSHKEAFLEKISITGPSRGGDLQLVKAKTMTVDIINSDSGSGRIPYTNLRIHDSVSDITVDTVTNNSGAFSKYMPADGTYKFSVNKTIGSAPKEFIMVGQNTGGKVTQNAATSTNYITAIFRTTTPTAYDELIGTLKFVDQKGNPLNGVDVKLKHNATSSSEVTFKTNASGVLDKGSYALSIGTYAITIEKSTGYYYSGNVTLYISNNDVTVETTKLDHVKFTDLGKDDKISVEAIEMLNEEKGVYYSDDREEGKDADGKGTGVYTQTYYFETEKEFLVKITNVDGDKLDYLYIPDTGPASDTMAVAYKEFTTITGYAGYPASGLVTIKDGSNNIISVVTASSSGRYTVDLPNLSSGSSYKFSSVLGKYTDPVTEVEDYAYKTVASKTVSDSLPESKIVNMVATGEPGPSEPNKIGANITGQTEVGGKITFDVTVTGNDYQSLFLSGGTDWESIEFTVGGKVVDHVNGLGTFSVEAYCKEGVAADSAHLSIIFKTAAGTTVLTKEILIQNVVSDKDAKAERGENDNYGDSEYKFAVSINNESNESVPYSVTADDTQESLKGWYLVFTDSEGTTVKDIPNDGGLGGNAKGQTVTNVYAKLINDGATELPKSFTVKVTVDGVDTQMTIEPTTTALNIDDGGATGPNIFGSEGSIPITVWAMIAGSILLFVLILWLGMKRGVFARKR